MTKPSLPEHPASLEGPRGHPFVCTSLPQSELGVQVGKPLREVYDARVPASEGWTLTAWTLRSRHPVVRERRAEPQSQQLLTAV